MGPTPIMSMREDRARGQQQPQSKALPIRRTAATLSTAATVWLTITFSWAWRWLYSGCAILSLLVVYGEANGTPAFHSIPPWTALATINLIYAITSTSWLQYRIFTAICWPCIIATFVFISSTASSVARTVSRRLLTQAYFMNDEIAGFSLPALHLDTDLEGLLTIRGWTFSMSTLTVEVHGVELAHNLTEEIHVALYCDNIVIRLCRDIGVGTIYGVFKREKFVVELGNLSQPTKENPVHFEPLMQPLRSNIRAFDSESGSQVAVDPPKSKAAFHEGTGPTRAKRSGDSRQKSDYDKIRREIHTTSPWYQYREQTKADWSTSK